ncbi:hypothetical protein MN0502_00700 [Arthrobacter sp. MN05-02]|nr:hypothetical protein MN0502_00700 [Arthrobacter sp. MN05-02]
MVNVCGLPAVTVPTLRLPDGLSMSVQLIGRPGEEAQLLAVTAQIEALRQEDREFTPPAPGGTME